MAELCRIAYRQEWQFVKVSVSDSGCGIPPEIIGKVLEPSYSTKEPGKGTGLGLSMLHGFVAQSGGGLTLESEPGSGTIMTVFLPRTMQLSSAEDDDALLQPLPTGEGSVLLVKTIPTLRKARRRCSKK